MQFFDCDHQWFIFTSQHLAYERGQLNRRAAIGWYHNFKFAALVAHFPVRLDQATNRAVRAFRLLGICVWRVALETAVGWIGLPVEVFLIFVALAK